MELTISCGGKEITCLMGTNLGCKARRDSEGWRVFWATRTTWERISDLVAAGLLRDVHRQSYNHIDTYIADTAACDALVASPCATRGART